MPNRKKKHNAAVGVFETKARAEQAVADLKAAGFTDSEIGMGTPKFGGRPGGADAGPQWSRWDHR